MTGRPDGCSARHRPGTACQCSTHGSGNRGEQRPVTVAPGQIAPVFYAMPFLFAVMIALN